MQANIPASFQIQSADSGTLVGLSLAGETIDTSNDPFVFQFDAQQYSTCNICAENIIISTAQATQFTNTKDVVCANADTKESPPPSTLTPPPPAPGTEHCTVLSPPTPFDGQAFYALCIQGTTVEVSLFANPATIGIFALKITCDGVPISTSDALIEKQVGQNLWVNGRVPIPNRVMRLVVVVAIDCCIGFGCFRMAYLRIWSYPSKTG